MTTETFFEKFEQFADLPNAVAKMREIVLQLAVRGQLTQQNSHELAKPQLEQAELFRVQSGHRGVLDAKSTPFPVPANWGWVAVGDAMEMVNGKAFKPEDWSSEGRPIIRIQNLNNEAAAFNYCQKTVEPRFHVDTGDFLISWSGTPGTSFGAFIWNRGSAYLNQHIFRCELVENVFVKAFLRLAVNARLDEMISHAQGAVGLRHITKGKLEGIRLPLPPLAEQKRIVAKVDELMALCDRLEVQQQKRETQHAVLARESLIRFAEAPAPATLQLLFHKFYTISPADLRKAILTLAVQGKLVPRNLGDEPASVTLPKLAAVAVADDQKSIPKHWLRVLLGDVGEWRGGGTPSKSRPEFWDGDIPWVSPKDMKILHISDAQDHISEAAVEKSSVRLIPAGSLLMVVRGMILARAFPVALTLREVTINQDMKALLPLEPETTDYLLITLRALEPDVLAAIEYSSHGTCKLKTEAMRKLIVPIPPLPEQRRIVAKVEQLLTLVDKLETLLAADRTHGIALIDNVATEFAT